LAAVFFPTVFTGAFFADDFFTVPLLETADAVFFAAQRFFRAATIAALPAALNLRFGLGATASGDD
jgi:hypothetical protein